MKISSLRSTTCAVALVAAAFASGCATPDFKPFASETATLGGAVSAEQSEIVAHFVQTKAKAETRDSTDSRVDQLATQQAAYAANAVALNAVLDVAVIYSTTLVDLAAAGETGSAAVDSLAQSLKGFASALSVVLPVIPVWAGELAKEIAQDVTRIQAQKSLAEAARTADPTVAKIARVITDLNAWPSGPQAAIVTGLQSTEEGVLRDIVGRNRIAFYQGINVRKVTIPDRAPQTRLEYFFGDVDDRIAKQNPAAGICGIAPLEPVRDARGQPVKDSSGNQLFAPTSAQRDDPNCLTGQTVQGLQAIVTLLAGIEPQFQAYTRDLAASRGWLEQRKATSAAISAAATAWAAEHGKLAAKLEECGGLHALRSSCGNLTFANFKLAVERVRVIAGKGGK